MCRPVSDFTSLQQHAVSAQYRKQIFPHSIRKNNNKQIKRCHALQARTTDRDSRQLAECELLGHNELFYSSARRDVCAPKAYCELTLRLWMNECNLIWMNGWKRSPHNWKAACKSVLPLATFANERLNEWMNPLIILIFNRFSTRIAFVLLYFSMHIYTNVCMFVYFLYYLHSNGL